MAAQDLLASGKNTALTSTVSARMARPKLPIWPYSHSSSQNSGLVKNQNQPQSMVRSNFSMPYFFSYASMTFTTLAPANTCESVLAVAPGAIVWPTGAMWSIWYLRSAPDPVCLIVTSTLVFWSGTRVAIQYLSV